MPMLKPKKTKNIYLFGIPSVIIALVIVVVLIIGYHRNEAILKRPESFMISDGEKPKIELNKVHHTATRNGVIEWNLDADSAAFMDDKKQAIFKNLSVTFFLESNQKIYLLSDQGTLYTESNDIEVSGSVILKSRDSVLETKKLYYQHDGRKFIAKAPVRITRNSFTLSANSMVFDPVTEKAWLKDKVEGVFSETMVSF